VVQEIKAAFAEEQERQARILGEDLPAR